MKINFYIRPSKTDIKPIKLYISMNDVRFYIHTEKHIQETKWDCKKQRVRLKFPVEAQVINPFLSDLEEKVWEMWNANPLVTPEAFKKLISDHLKPSKVKQPETARSFFSLYDEFIRDTKNRINLSNAKVLSRGTLGQYESAKETLKKFEVFEQKEKPSYVLSFDNINSQFYSAFRAFCIDEEEHSPNTFGNKIKRLKTFLFWCQDRDIPVSNKFKNFEIPQSYKDAEPLRSDELKELWEKDLGPSQWKLDIMLALCSTGMRISDYNEVMTNMNYFIQKTKEGDALVFRSQKTGLRCTVPMFNDDYFRVKYLYEKYSGSMPKLTGQSLNEFLKESGLFKRIDVTSKTGRKTFCSIKYFELGIEAQYIMPITGHKTEAEFKKYLGVSANTIIKANREKSSYTKAL
jgi:hypothetical protein